MNSSKSRTSFESARAARLAAIQALFQISSSGRPPQIVIQEFIDHRLDSEEYPYPPDQILFKKLVERTCERENDLMPLIDANLSEPWSVNSLESVLREILKLGCLELLESITPLPVPVVISEYIDLTKGFFGPTEGHLTNAVLDRIARALGLPLTKA